MSSICVFKNKDYDLTIISHTEPLDIDIYSRPGYYFDYHNQKFNDLMSEINVTIDDKARAKLYGDAQKILSRTIPVNVFLYILPKIHRVQI